LHCTACRPSANLAKKRLGSRGVYDSDGSTRLNFHTIDWTRGQDSVSGVKILFLSDTTKASSKYSVRPFSATLQFEGYGKDRQGNEYQYRGYNMNATDVRLWVQNL
jgi:hypothetical protein